MARGTAWNAFFADLWAPLPEEARTRYGEACRGTPEQRKGLIEAAELDITGTQQLAWAAWLHRFSEGISTPDVWPGALPPPPREPEGVWEQALEGLSEDAQTARGCANTLFMLSLGRTVRKWRAKRS